MALSVASIENQTNTDQKNAAKAPGASQLSLWERPTHAITRSRIAGIQGDEKVEIIFNRQVDLHDRDNSPFDPRTALDAE
jgi:hypothetical protein